MQNHEENGRVKFMPTDPLMPLLDARCPSDMPVGKVYGKVKGILMDYAESINMTPRRLRVIDVFDGAGEIQVRLMRYIEQRPRRSSQSMERWKSYQLEVRSRLRRLSKVLTQNSVSSSQNLSIADQLLSQAPDWLRPAIPYLTRDGVRAKGRCIDDPEDRLNLPLNDNGLIGLTVLLNVWRRFAPGSLKELLVGHSPTLCQEIRRLAPTRKIECIYRQMWYIRSKLGLKIPPRQRRFLPVAEWPQPLRQEWEVFAHIAENGVGADQELSLSAKRLKVNVGRLSPETVAIYRYAMEAALGLIRPSGELSISDLIRLVPRTDIPADYEGPTEHNRLVDLFRASERAKQGRAKPEGYDSEIFRDFLSVIKAVAARNGYGRLIRRFSQAYILFMDTEGKEERRAQKKEGIPIHWVDRQIELLYLRFLKIVKTGSYKFSPGRITGSRRDIALVLFFVWFVTLRYMGYRQQCLVRCVIGDNFIFNPDGSIILFFKKNKNGKQIRMVLNADSQGTHGLLWSVLTLYYKKVYPYLVRESGDTLKGRLFVTTAEDFSFRHFTHNRDFNTSWVIGRNKFLEVDELAPEMRHKLNPHFLRGLCADWMIIILHMSFDEAAEVLGDDPMVLKLAYVDKNRVHDAGAVFEAVNKRRQSMLAELNANARIEGSLERIEKNYQKSLAAKDEEIASLRSLHEENQMKIAELTARFMSGHTAGAVVTGN